jgi:hypothetical protein
MLVEFPARFFNRLIRVTTSRRGSHDLFDANFRSMAVISRHAATHVALVVIPSSIPDVCGGSVTRGGEGA